MSLSIALLLLASGGCAFDRKWRDLSRQQRLHAVAPAAATTAPASDPLAGRWEGKWVSDASGHAGKLRAIVTPLPNADAAGGAPTYRVDYDAMFLAVLRFGYGMTLTAAPQPGGATRFEGRDDLGPLAGGVYRYTGSADGRTFTATYTSPADHGRFEMTRPKK